MHEKINYSPVTPGGEVLVARYKLATEYQCALGVIKVIRNRWTAYARGSMWQRYSQVLFSYRFRSVSC